jgi:hypothetical protein
MQPHSWRAHGSGADPARMGRDFNKPSIPRSAPPSPKLTSADKDVLEIAKYTENVAQKSTFSICMSPWGAAASSLTQFADHLPSSLSSTAVRKLHSAKRRNEAVDTKSVTNHRKHLDPKVQGRPEKVSQSVCVTWDEASQRQDDPRAQVVESMQMWRAQVRRPKCVSDCNL